MSTELLPVLCYGSMGLASVLLSYEAYSDYQATSNKWARTSVVLCAQVALLSLILVLKHL